MALSDLMAQLGQYGAGAAPAGSIKGMPAGTRPEWYVNGNGEDNGSTTPMLGGYANYTGGNTYHQYDTSGNLVGDMPMDGGSSPMAQYGWIIPAALSGGALAGVGGLGAGAAAEGGIGAGAGGFGLADATAAGYGGLDAAGAATMGGGASIGGGSALGAFGGAGAAGAAGGGGGGFGSMLQQLGGSAKTIGGIGSTLSSLFSGGGGQQQGGGGGGIFGNLGNMNLGNLGGILASLYGGQQQGNAANQMKSWLQGQQGKIDNLYNPGTPEYNQLWDQMSRQDAAAGRNSQYGPRSVDLAAKIAQIKADETQRFTTGTSRAYADALNGYANRYAGLSGVLGQTLGPNTGGINLNSLMQMLSGAGSHDMTNAANIGAANDATAATDYAGLSPDAWANAGLNTPSVSAASDTDPYSVFW